jgi:hypothetical protein
LVNSEPKQVLKLLFLTLKQNIMTTTIKITEKKKNGATEILVDSQYYNEDLMYQEVTIDTYMAQTRKEQFIEMLKAI